MPNKKATRYTLEEYVKTPEFARWFWKNVKKGETEDECWLWTGGIANSGYGQMQARGVSSQPMLMHRVAWVFFNGPIPDGLHVLHRCDVRRCIKPTDLFLGTAGDNNRDRTQKGRTASGDKNGARTKPERNPFVINGGSGLTGEQHPQTKLSDKDVIKLRQLYAAGATFTALAKEFDLSINHASRIARGVARREVQHG